METACALRRTIIHVEPLRTVKFEHLKSIRVGECAVHAREGATLALSSSVPCCSVLVSTSLFILTADVVSVCANCFLALCWHLCVHTRNGRTSRCVHLYICVHPVKAAVVGAFRAMAHSQVPRKVTQGLARPHRSSLTGCGMLCTDLYAAVSMTLAARIGQDQKSRLLELG
jgi:hypothetical protein